MIVNTRKTNDVRVIYPVGEFIYEKANPVRDIFEKALSDKESKILINLKDTTYLDSSGIGILIRYFSELRKTGGELVICSSNKAVKNVLHMAKVHKFIKIFNNEEESLNVLQSLQVQKAAAAAPSQNLSRHEQQLDDFDLNIIEIMSLLLEAEATNKLETNKIIMLLDKIKVNYNELYRKLKARPSN